jgi:DNA-binding MurR/RpiR family transcriptional regulator
MDGGLVRLREALNNITPSERKVAEFILNHPEQLVGFSIAQLAQTSGGSQAAVIRLCKSTGFKSYQELMLKVAGDLHQHSESNGYREFNRSDSIENIIENVSNNNIQSIRDTVKILDVIHVQKAVDALARAKRIYFFGIGASNLIAVDAHHKFMRINKSCFSFTDPDLQLVSSVMMTYEDVVVGISYSGESPTVIECLKQAQELGSTIISITGYGQSTISRMADIPLHISSTESEIRSGATTSRITQLNVIDILYLGVASREYDRSVSYLEKSRNIVKKMKK